MAKELLSAFCFLISAYHSLPLIATGCRPAAKPVCRARQRGATRKSKSIGRTVSRLEVPPTQNKKTELNEGEQILGPELDGQIFPLGQSISFATREEQRSHRDAPILGAYCIELP